MDNEPEAKALIEVVVAEEMLKLANDIPFDHILGDPAQSFDFELALEKALQ